MPGGFFGGFDSALRKIEKLKDIDTIISQALLDTGHEVQADAKRNCRVDTGRLRSSITTKQTAPNEVLVGTNVKYAPDVEFGTKPHIITPKTKKVLRWEAKVVSLLTKSGRPRKKPKIIKEARFARRVKHPGTKPHPYLRPAFDKHVPRTLGIRLRARVLKAIGR